MSPRSPAPRVGEPQGTSCRSGACRTGVIAACVFAMSLCAAGCTAEQHEPAAAMTAAAGTAADELPLQEFMGHVVAHAAQDLWNWQGWVTDAGGEHSQFPQNDAEWEEAESAALVLGELMTLLLQPGRRVNVPEWEGSTLMVRRLAREAAQAAQRHDETAFFELGTQINEACDVCHRATGVTL